MYSTHQKGEIAQLRVQLQATEKGIIVSRPTTDARYDLILDDGKSLTRAQVKYADHWVNHAAVELALHRDTRNNGKRRPYTKSEIDAVLVYVPEAQTILWLPPAVFHGKKTVTLRFEKPRNNQKKFTDANKFRW